MSDDVFAALEAAKVAARQCDLVAVVEAIDDAIDAWKTEEALWAVALLEAEKAAR